GRTITRGGWRLRRHGRRQAEQGRVQGFTGRLRGAARHRRVPRPAPPLPRLRLPGDRRLPDLVPALRGAVELGRRVHEHPADRQHQRRTGLRAPPVRHDLRPGLPLRPVRQQDVRPGGRGARGALQPLHRSPRQPPRPRGGRPM
ncbi:MAG: Integral membrane protein, partial [uncultured Nocardioidaceae bacterium]